MRRFGVAVVAAVVIGSAMPASAQSIPTFNWTGFYFGVNAGAVWDRNELGQVRLSSPGFFFSDPTGAFAGIPVEFFGFPGASAAVPTNRSGPDAAFIGGGQIGYNWQSGRVVYGVEADLQLTRSQQTVNATLAEFAAGLLPTANITRTSTANFSIERVWQASLRGRVGHTWDRTLVYVTGGIAVTSLNSTGTFTYVTTLGPALTGLPIAPPQNLTGAGPGSNEVFVGVTLGAGFEYAIAPNISIGGEYRYTDFGKRNLLLGTTPQAGVLFPPTTVETTMRLASHALTARLNYRFGDQNDPYKAMAAVPAAAFNWNGCYTGGHLGVAWSASTVDTFDPSTNTGVFGPPPLLQTPFYNSSAAQSAVPAPYGYDLKASAMVGATLGCNWQAPASPVVWGAEAEGGFMRLSGTTANPYNILFGFNDHTDSTRIGSWYGILAGRLGYAVDRTLLYLKTGVGLTHVAANSTDICSTLLTCSSQILNATGSATPVFFVAGAGAEWAWAERWTLKVEYLYLALHETFAVCGPGSGRLFVPNLVFCSNHTVGAIHTGKVGVNYRF